MSVGLTVLGSQWVTDSDSSLIVSVGLTVLGSQWITDFDSSLIVSRGLTVLGSQWITRLRHQGHEDRSSGTLVHPL